MPRRRAADHAHFAVTPGLPGYPFDRVIAVVHVVDERAILPFTGEAAAAILHHADVAPLGVGLFLFLVRRGLSFVIGRAREHDRPRPLALGQEDVGGQLHAVAHRHHHFLELGPGGGSRSQQPRCRQQPSKRPSMPKANHHRVPPRERIRQDAPPREMIELVACDLAPTFERTSAIIPRRPVAVNEVTRRPARLRLTGTPASQAPRVRAAR